MPLIDYAKTGKTIYDVDLQQPAEARWKQVAADLGNELQQLVRDIVELCEEEARAFPAWLRPLVVAAGHGVSRLGGRLIGWIAGCFDQEYTAEIGGIARYAEVPYSQALLANLMYDITQIQNRCCFACSSYSCNIDAQPVLAHNMDWEWPESLGRHTILVRFHRGRDAYLSVSVLGSVGILSAMHPGHWAITLNQAPVEKLGINWLQCPALQRLRTACDGFGSFSALARRVAEYETMAPFFAHAVGTKPKEHLVVNGFGTAYSRRRSENGLLIQTNHFIGEELQALNSPEEFLGRDGITYYSDSQPRYQALKRRLGSLPKSLESALGKLKRRPVTHTGTMHSMALCPATGDYRVQVAA